MKSKFPEYYRIHKDDLLDRFDDCVFIFDACALLDIYRLKEDLTENVFKVLEHLKEQIRIPYHVAEEYTGNIHEVLNKQLQTIKESRNSFDGFVKTFESKRSHPYMSKEATDLVEQLKKQVNKDFTEQEDYIKDQLIHGIYQNRMANLLDGRVLEPFSPEEILSIQTEGATRYEKRIPPGYKDANKSDNRYGDLINWKEILRYAKESGKHIIIVSSEIKEDWVTKEQGQIVGLRYELIKEFYHEVGNTNQYLHFFSLDRFLEFAREKDEQVITQETVNEVKNYVVLTHDYNYYLSDGYLEAVRNHHQLYKQVIDSWKSFLEDKVGSATFSDVDKIIKKKGCYSEDDKKSLPKEDEEKLDEIKEEDKNSTDDQEKKSDE